MAASCRVLKLHRQHYYGWLGAPCGDAVMGGHAATANGVLTPAYRWAAAGQAALLLLISCLLLGRGALVRVPGMSERGLRTAAWVIAGFFTLNTLANVTSPHPLERWMGAATILIALASATLAAFPMSPSSIGR